MNRVLLLLMGLLCGVMALGQVRDLGPAIQMTQWIGSDTWSWTLARTSKAVQQHLLELRAVMNDFATNKIGPIEADRLLKERTGGQGLAAVLKEFESILVGVPELPGRPR